MNKTITKTIGGGTHIKWLDENVLMLYITLDSSYKDKVKKNNFTTFILRWEGQSKNNNYDESVKIFKVIYVFMRKDGNDNYKFVGDVIEKKLLNERSDTEPLRMEFIVNRSPVVLPFLTEIPFYDYKKYNEIQASKSKKKSFEILGLRNIKNNWNSGIMIGEYI